MWELIDIEMPGGTVVLEEIYDYLIQIKYIHNLCHPEWFPYSKVSFPITTNDPSARQEPLWIDS